MWNYSMGYGKISRKRWNITKINGLNYAIYSKNDKSGLKIYDFYIVGLGKGRVEKWYEKVWIICKLYKRYSHVLKTPGETKMETWKNIIKEEKVV